MAHPRPRQNYLWIARKKAGLGQKSVARLLGDKSIPSLSLYETGQRLPGLRTAFKLAAVYEVPLLELYAPLYEEMEADIESRRKAIARVSHIPPEHSATL